MSAVLLCNLTGHEGISLTGRSLSMSFNPASSNSANELVAEGASATMNNDSLTKLGM